MQILTVLLFFLYTWGFGYTTISGILRIIKESENGLERNVMRIAIGLAIFIVLGVILNLLKIPLDWKVFFALSMIYPIIMLFRNFKNGKLKKINLNFNKLKIKKSAIWNILALAIFLFSVFMYSGGSFAYPYLENDDPWAHAAGTKYVSVEKTVSQPENYQFHYIDPYPPGYEMWMGVLHQTNGSVYWTLKFFNGLFIALGILFFYFFAKSFTKDSKKALVSTFILALIPCYFTHFIWAHTLVITLMFPALYCYEKIKENRKWVIIATLIIAAIALTHTSEAVKIIAMILIYAIVKCIFARKFLTNYFVPIFMGLLISGLWWFKKAFTLFGETAVRLENKGIIETGSRTIWQKIHMFFLPDSGSASRVYNFSDFFFAKSSGMINVQVGWGILITILLVIGLVMVLMNYRKLKSIKNEWIVITLVWFLFAFLGTNSMTFNLPIGLFAFRFWLLLAIPVALLSTLGLSLFTSIGKKIKIPVTIIVVILLAGIFFTAGYQKYQHNTSENWPPGAKWTSVDELQGFIWLHDLPDNTKVFKYTKAIFVFGFDKYSCEWCPEVIEFRESLYQKSATELHAWLKLNEYEYLVLSGMDIKYISKELPEEEGTDKTERAQQIFEQIMKEIQETNNLFSLAHQTNGAVILKVI